MSTHVYKQTYQKITLFQGKSSSFIAWLCPLLSPLVVTEKQILYHDGDVVTNIFFHEKGDIGMCLPKYGYARYINFEEGAYFGVVDIVGSI